ncbi:MAG: hypothetical protein ACRC6E_05325 [Fusobacteriaceae bacterium]
MSKNLREYAKSKYSSETHSSFMARLKRIEEEKVEVHKIPVKGGILNVVVEEGVPKITYLADGDFYVKMLSENSLKFVVVE